MYDKIYQCIICSGVNTTININSKHDLLNESVKSDSSLLSQKLEVVFLLRKLLQFPTVELENQLKESNNDPRK